jgi:hypothetical protein
MFVAKQLQKVLLILPLLAVLDAYGHNSMREVVCFPAQGLGADAGHVGRFESIFHSTTFSFSRLYVICQIPKIDEVRIFHRVFRQIQTFL